MQFYKDLKAYWVKGKYCSPSHTSLYVQYCDVCIGGAHSITKTRSVHLTKSILEFLVKSRHTVSLR